MSEEPEVIRAQIQQTRNSLSDKLEALEQHVVDTVHDASDAVAETVGTIKDAAQETVGTVKDTVNETVNTVRETLDVPLQFKRRPWLMFGGCVALGYLAGRIGARSRPMQSAPPLENFAVRPLAAQNGNTATAPKAGFGEWVGNALEPEIAKLKGLAIGAAMATVRDLVGRNVEGAVGDDLRHVIDDVTQRLGGRVFEQAPLSTEPVGSKRHNGLTPARAETLRRF